MRLISLIYYVQHSLLGQTSSEGRDDGGQPQGRHHVPHRGRHHGRGAQDVVRAGGVHAHRAQTSAQQAPVGEREGVGAQEAMGVDAVGA